jgi:GDPmannose 4,6-dehydratase
MATRALITGITGQDGSYLAEHLLSLGYEVHGIVRRVAMEAPESRFARLSGCLDRIVLHAATLESYPSIFQVISHHHFDECYHLAAQSFVGETFADGFSTLSTNTSGVHYVLAALHEMQPRCRFYFAGSSEMFGSTRETPQRETTPFQPRSPYGISKVAGYHLTRNYREQYGMFAATGILFNHESPRRGHEFVTRKISRGAARVKAGLATEVRLGNLNAARDWGHARDYVRAMHLMLQQDRPDDYVVATGQSHTVAQFAELAFGLLGLDYRNWVKVDEQFVRPSDADILVGDATHAREALGWAPEYTFEELVREMVENDYAELVPGEEAPFVQGWRGAGSASSPPASRPYAARSSGTTAAGEKSSS